MIKITTESGTVYEIYPDTRNYKRIRGQSASYLTPDVNTGVYDEISGVEVGERMLITIEGAGKGVLIHSTPIVRIDIE